MDPADREMTLRRLAAAEGAIAGARKRVARQRALIAKLERENRNLAYAYGLLARLEAARADRERRLAMLLKELAGCGWTFGDPSSD